MKAANGNGETVEVEEGSSVPPHWTHVVIEVLLSLLSSESHVMRGLASCVFALLAPHVDDKAMAVMLNVRFAQRKLLLAFAIGQDAERRVRQTSNLRRLESSCEFNPGETDLVSASSCLAHTLKRCMFWQVFDPELAAVPGGEDEDSEDEGDEFGEEMEVESDDAELADESDPGLDSAFRDSVKEAMGPAAPGTDIETVDLDTVDPEDMKGIDEALAAAFEAATSGKKSAGKRRSKLAGSETKLMHMRLR